MTIISDVCTQFVNFVLNQVWYDCGLSKTKFCRPRSSWDRGTRPQYLNGGNTITSVHHWGEKSSQIVFVRRFHGILFNQNAHFTLTLTKKLQLLGNVVPQAPYQGSAPGSRREISVPEPLLRPPTTVIDRRRCCRHAALKLLAVYFGAVILQFYMVCTIQYDTTGNRLLDVHCTVGPGAVMVRTLACHSRGRGFNSRPFRCQLSRPSASCSHTYASVTKQLSWYQSRGSDVLRLGR